jgi:hypothetical protein
VSEIRFFSELGDRLERAAAAELRRTDRRRWRPLRGRARLAALAVLLLGGGVAAAAAVLSNNSTATLVATGLVCHSGADQQDSHDLIFTSALTLRGRGRSGSPTATCAAQLADAGDGRWPASALVACASRRSGIEVYLRDGRAGQCSRLGLRPLPSGIHMAVNQVAALDAALAKLSTSANCVAPAKFDAGVKSILRRRGFAGWRVKHRPAQFSGHCGQFPSAELGFDAQMAVHGSTQTVAVTTGPSRSIYQITNEMQASLGATRRCLTVPVLEREARDELHARASHPVKLTFGVFHNAREDVLGPHTQRLYNRGCAIFVFVSPGQSSDLGGGRAVTERPGFRVTILQRNAPRELPGFKFEEHGR